MEANLNFLEDHFSARVIAPKTWLIETKELEKNIICQCYLIEGEEFAIAIDSGSSNQNVFEFMQTCTDLPIHGVINTHSHFDHTQGNKYFKNVYIHNEAVTPEPEPGLPEGIAKQYRNEKGEVVWQEFDNGVHEDEKNTYVKDGFTINLGDRELEIIEIGAHDAASIAILDKKMRLLYSGDELETGWCNVGSMRSPRKKCSTIENHYNNMLKLKAREDEFDMICPGHHGAPIAKESLTHQIIVDRMILDGYEGSADIPFCVLFGTQADDARIMRYKTAHRCYTLSNIFDSQMK